MSKICSQWKCKTRTSKQTNF